MAKCLAVFITLLVVLVFMAGCPSLKPERAEHVEPEGLKLEPVETKPNAVESDDVAPYSGISNQLESDKIEPIELELNNAEPVITGQNEPKQPKVMVEEVTPAMPSGPSEVERAMKPAVSFHGKCAQVLKDFVDDKGMVDYTTLRRQRLKLKALLREFENLEPNEYRTWTKENKIAFWINAYNIQMLKIITDNYPIRSARILRLYPGWGPNSILHIKGIWTDYKFLVMDEEFTLSEIDKRFFREEFDDPRVYFALSRGSLSSPTLRNEPYYGHKLNKQLNGQVKRFLSSPLALHINTEKQRVYLSSLFQSSSYGKEFIDKFAIDKKFKDHDPATRAVLNFITHYVSKDKVSFLEIGNYSVKYMKYDWTINDGS
ncbi:MAG: DUF547 domain-containing protein [Planctomycetes bacterium]|nr:DUF547 domain-containing protein [Planctomycetota bacterium]